MTHFSVLQKEVIRLLAPKPNENFIDATFGLGGHTTAILDKNKPGGKVLGIEVDSKLYQDFLARLAETPNTKLQILNRLVLVNDSYVNLKKIVKEYNFQPVHGILFDLGMSSWHLEESGRGFTFQRDEPLDMRYLIAEDAQRSLSGYYQGTAEEVINKWGKEEVKRILREYGGERFAGRIARKIVEARKQKPIKTTFQLKEIIKKAVPQKYRLGRINPATRTFQALRITVNDELNNLSKTLPQALEVLEKNGRIAVISFHSGEDRIVKNFFRESFQKGLLRLITKKPITASAAEIQKNPPSRSAKLRVAIKSI